MFVYTETSTSIADVYAVIRVVDLTFTGVDADNSNTEVDINDCYAAIRDAAVNMADAKPEIPDVDSSLRNSRNANTNVNAEYSFIYIVNAIARLILKMDNLR